MKPYRAGLVWEWSQSEIF